MIGELSRVAETNGHAKASPPPHRITITPPKIRRLKLSIVGTAPFLMCAFPKKAMDKIMEKQQQGEVGNKGKKPARSARDYNDDFQQSLHRITKTTYGIPASAFRSAAISACRVADFKMTLAKLSIFIEPDGFDMVNSMPLVCIKGKPEMHQMIGRNANDSCDIRTRAIFKEWSAIVTVRFDEDQFQIADIYNLFARVGEQVGVGEGRHDSRNSAGMGFGTFTVENKLETSVVS